MPNKRRAGSNDKNTRTPELSQEHKDAKAQKEANEKSYNEHGRYLDPDPETDWYYKRGDYWSYAFEAGWNAAQKYYETKKG